MKPELLVVLAVLMYGGQNVFLERFLAQGINITTFQMWFNGTMCLFAILMAIPNGGIAILPLGQIGSIALLASLFFLADLCVFLAYAGKGSAIMVGSIMTAMPIVVGVVRYAISKKVPTLYEILGTVLVIVGVLLFFKK